MQNEITDDTTLELILGEPEILHLTTENDSYIGNVNKIMEIEECIYVLSDFKQLLKYDKKGNNIFKISKQGSGKGEYINIFDFDVYDNEIYVTTRTNRIVVYNAKNGLFVKDITLDSDCSAITVANDKLYCEAVAKGPAINIYNLGGKFINAIGDNSNNPPVMSPTPFVKINNNHIGYTVFDVNDIIEINTDTDSIYFSNIMSMDNVLTIGEYHEIVTKYGEINEYGLIDVKDKMDAYYCISAFRKCYNNIFIAFYKGNNNYFCLPNIKNSKTAVYSTSRVIDDRFGADVNVLIDNASYCISNHHLITFIQPHDIVNETAKTKYASNITSGNPTLLLFSL